MQYFLFSELLKRVGNSNVDLGKVISPVGQYIRSNPGQPQLIRQIKPKATKHFDDDLGWDFVERKFSQISHIFCH